MQKTDPMTEPAPEPEPPLAPPDSLHGQLQRGRGRGFLRALEAEPTTVHALLLDCITHDPRWDSQIEDREDYYARLAIATQMSVAPLGEYLRTAEDDRLGWATFLTVETLGALAGLGDIEAVGILREYVGYGAKWDAALRELAELPDSAATAGLADVLCGRFETGQQMNESSVYGLLNSGLYTLWQSWHQTHPCMAQLLDEVQAIHATYKRVTAPDYSTYSPAGLLAAIDRKNWWRIRKILLSRIQFSDMDQYVAAFGGENPFAWATAFECLAALGQAASFYDTILHKLVAYLESVDPKAIRGPGQRGFRIVLEQLPAESILPIARRWLDSEEWHLRHIAAGILETQAAVADIPQVRTILISALNSAILHDQDYYRLSAALDILARFPDIGLLAEVEAAFIQASYSYARWRAARAMRVNAPAIVVETYAYECLWDCQEETRQIGCETVPLTIPGARERLQALRDDRGEGEELRQAAAGRLAAEE